MTTSAGGEPLRTCVGCRKRRSVRGDRLVRVVLREGVVQALRGKDKRPPGRGAWLCPTGDCVRAAIKSRAFARAFRRAVELPNEETLITRVTGAPLS